MPSPVKIVKVLSKSQKRNAAKRMRKFQQRMLSDKLSGMSQTSQDDSFESDSSSDNHQVSFNPEKTEVIEKFVVQP